MKLLDLALIGGGLLLMSRAGNTSPSTTAPTSSPTPSGASLLPIDATVNQIVAAASTVDLSIQPGKETSVSVLSRVPGSYQYEKNQLYYTYLAEQKEHLTPLYNQLAPIRDALAGLRNSGYDFTKSPLYPKQVALLERISTEGAALNTWYDNAQAELKRLYYG